MSEVDISILLPNISANIVGASTMLARMLDQHYKVEVVGTDFGDGISPMYQGAYDYTPFYAPEMAAFPGYVKASRRLGDSLNGRVIISIKAYLNTIPVAIRQKKIRDAKVIAYLDEWDGALWKRWQGVEKAKVFRRELRYALSDFNCGYSERWLKHADKVLSTTTFLQNRFGGDILHWGVDPEVFCPQNDVETQALKSSLGLDAYKLIVFGGVVRPHKGVEEILDALVFLQRKDLKLLVVGPKTPHLEGLMSEAKYQPYIACTGALQREEMPKHLGLADLIVLPLKDDLLAQSQMPCKVFEAMSMEKPVVATSVSDLPLILEGCGRTCAPGNLNQLAQAMSEVLDDAGLAQQLGQAARAKVLETYNIEHTQKQLLDTVAELLR